MKFLKLKKLRSALAVCAAAATLLSFQGGAMAAGFQEYPIGDEQEDTTNHFKVALVYFQPVEMDNPGMGLTPDKADIHIETDISATEGNECGFGVGDWIPYIRVDYKFTKKGTGEVIEGAFMPMSADDGPHYGANVKLAGAGEYICEFAFHSPEEQGYVLHVDKETGVPGRFWKTPVVMKWNFNYVPRKW